MLSSRSLPRFLIIILLLCAPFTSSAADKLTVMLDWFVNPDHGPLIIARENGLFAGQDLEVELIAPANPNDPPKLVAAGKVDIAVSYQPQLHIHVEQGLPLMRVATLVDSPLNSIVVLEKSNIRSIADLKGRKVGYSVGGFEDVLMKAILANHDLGLEDVEMINVNFSLSPALISGQVDAVIGAFRNFELNQMDIVGAPGRAFFIEEEGIPPYDELIIVIHRDNAKNDAIRRFLVAVENAAQFILNHPEQAWQTFKATDKVLDDELNRRAWIDTVPRFTMRPAAMDTGRYQRFADFLRQQGMIKKNLPVSEYAVDINAP